MGEATERAEIINSAALPKDIGPRAASAVVLAAVALSATWIGGSPFVVLILLIGVLMAWEWSRIIRGTTVDLALAFQVAAIAVAVVLTGFGLGLWALAALAAGVVAVAAAAPKTSVVLSALGVAYVGLPAIAMVWLRSSDGYGAAAILFVFVIVWTTDTFAYLCGRAIGGPRLWPALSPRKTWAGTLGGIGFAALAGAAFSVLLPPAHPIVLAVTAVALSIVAQIGDLAESALKRAYAVKNASDLIPGHGGFMDRMDGVVTAVTLAALLTLCIGPQNPARALLFWS